MDFIMIRTWLIGKRPAYTANRNKFGLLHTTMVNKESAHLKLSKYEIFVDQRIYCKEIH